MSFTAVNPMTVRQNNSCEQCEGDGYFIESWVGHDGEMREFKVNCECRETDHEPD